MVVQANVKAVEVETAENDCGSYAEGVLASPADWLVGYLCIVDSRGLHGMNHL
jgi:hypothetical protein